MGFGEAVYKPVLNQLGAEVVTVDLTKPADFKTVEEAISVHSHFDTVNICTPNFTHEDIARRVAGNSSIVFVEKPGVRNSAAWESLVNSFPKTNFMMVKNNQYRDSIKQFKELADRSNLVKIVWDNKNRIPHPGSWFTNKELSFGGVSRDLLPHMLSYYTCLTDYQHGVMLFSNSEQNHSLESIDSTDYGVINPAGVYNVDDYAELQYSNLSTTWVLSANWKDDLADDVHIYFDTGERIVIEPLGLCPEGAYKTMIETAVANLNNKGFWKEQFQQDLWIHRQLEIL